MQNNKYLYNTDEVPIIPTKILDTRLKLLKANLSELLSHNFRVRDLSRVNAVLKAIKHWESINNI